MVLLATGIRMVGQQRELAEARVLQERNRVARQLGEDLLVHLGAVWAAAQGAVDSSSSPEPRSPNRELVFAAEVRDGRLVLPWEDRDAQVGPGEMPLLGQGERQEGGGNLEAATVTYQRALDGATSQEHAGMARLFLARVLVKRGRSEDARVHYRALLTFPTGVTDEVGVPLSFYAAERILTHGLGVEEIVPFMSREAQRADWLTPWATHLLHDVAGELTETLPAGLGRDSAAVAETRVANRVREVEQALALAGDLNSSELSSPGSAGSAPDRWVLYGSASWLVGLGRASDETTLLTAIRAQEALEAASSPMAETLFDLEIAPEWAPEGVLLNPRLRGLRVRFALAEAEGLESTIGRQRAFYSIAFLLVVGFTLFGGYLLWRDVQREVRMARLRSQFVSGVSHELRTPLTSIRMFAETLLHRGPEDRETHDEFLGTIVDESNRLSRLLGNVLEFSAIEGGKRQYHMHPHDLGEIVHAAVRAIQQRLDSGQFALEMALAEDLPPVPVDGDAIEQAVLNLLTNAMKYSGESRRIDLGLRREDGNAVISVSDRGMGIRPSDRRRIFESFYRADSPAVEEVPGTGLGLTLVEHIVTAHGGSVELESNPGQGSTFILRLPLEARDRDDRGRSDGPKRSMNDADDPPEPEHP
jgi:signal transduction histidine kinase